MLLVDDHEAEFFKCVAAFVKQRVCADDDLRFPAAPLSFVEQRHHRVFIAGTGAQREVDAKRFEPAFEIQVVLLGKNLRRCHERGLVTGFHGEQHRGKSNDGFAGADIAVEQAVHRTRRGQIGANFRDRAVLRAGERERQQPVKPLHRPARSAVRLAGLRDRFRAARGDEKLHREKFLEHEMALRLLQLVPRTGEMNPPQRLRAAHGIQTGRQQRPDARIVEKREHVPDGAPQHAR